MAFGGCDEGCSRGVRWIGVVEAVWWCGDGEVVALVAHHVLSLSGLGTCPDPHDQIRERQ